MTESNIKPQVASSAADASPGANDKWDDSEFQSHQKPNWLKTHQTEVIGFAALSVILLAVIFWLPNAVEQPPHDSAAPAQSPQAASSPPEAASNAKGDVSPTPSPKSTGPLESPWQDAQTTKARRAAQEILAKLLDKQTTLESMQVNLWAKDAFEAATLKASEGDELYRTRAFDDALASYETALKLFEQLVAQAESEFTQAITAGDSAIANQQPQAAVDAYTLATAIRPNNSDAQTGLARAKVQEQLIDHLETADNLMLQYQYQEAKEHINQALSLDGESKIAAEKLVEINKAIAEGNFASHMGQGYSHLEQGQYSKAIAQFKKAQALKPNNQTARDAIVQASNQQTQHRIQQALQLAAQQEDQEQWLNALSNYQAAQTFDSSLVAARVGILRTQARAQLDEQLQRLIDQPLRLADPAVYRSAQQLLSDASNVKPRGPRIEKQQQQLQQALEKALDPVAVLLRSDNQTQVTLYRVGPLGNFKEQTLELKPGRYTLVGSRNGYRDVREEFTLQPGTNAKTIVIQCEERIALGG